MLTHTSILALIESEKITPDRVQLKVIEHLQEIADQLIEKVNNKKTLTKNNAHTLNTSPTIIKKRFKFLFGLALPKSNQPSIKETRIVHKKIKGMYIWGDVGRGKTWLMDQFYHSMEINEQDKIQRIHFHEFMLSVHKQLQDLPTQPDPLDIIGKNMSQQYRLICLDEFHVLDIADAVILHGLLKSLFENDVTLVTTSNRYPDTLYKNGSHRERFLSAIELIKENMHIEYLDTDTDYRKQQNQFEEVFLIPHTNENDQAIQKQLATLFEKYAKSKEYSTQEIKIAGREIAIIREYKHCIWFTFDVLCRGARSSSDYLKIARIYDVIILSEVPILHEGEEGPARRFLNLIDAFYDQNIHLILSSSIAIEYMYQGDLLQFEFERALSRLHEMQSHSWWHNFD